MDKLITSKELGDKFHEVAKELCVAGIFLYTLGYWLGEKVFGTYNKYAPILGIVPRRYPYKAPVSVSEVVVPTPVKKRRTRSKKPTLVPA